MVGSLVFGKVAEDRKQAIEHILGMKETLVLLRCLIQIGGAPIQYTRAGVASTSN